MELRSGHIIPSPSIKQQGGQEGPGSHVKPDNMNFLIRCDSVSPAQAQKHTKANKSELELCLKKEKKKN